MGPRLAIAATMVTIAADAHAGFLQLLCQGGVEGTEQIGFTIAIDMASADISDVDFRWTTRDGDVTIDWNLNRQSGALRGVILTGAAAGLQIAGDCDRRRNSSQAPSSRP